MKSLKIYETLEFKQGGDPYEKLKIGSNREIKIGDRFKCLQSVYSEINQGVTTYSIGTSYIYDVPIIRKEEEFIIESIHDNKYTVLFKEFDFFKINSQSFNDLIKQKAIKYLYNEG